MEEEWTWENNGIEKVGSPTNERERKQIEVGVDIIFLIYPFVAWNWRSWLVNA